MDKGVDLGIELIDAREDGFEELGLRRVDLHTDADNARGIRCYEKCGFVREGVMRERRVRYGKPLDMVLMAVLRDEWQVDSEQ